MGLECQENQCARKNLKTILGIPTLDWIEIVTTPVPSVEFTALGLVSLVGAAQYKRGTIDEGVFSLLSLN